MSKYFIVLKNAGYKAKEKIKKREKICFTDRRTDLLITKNAIDN